MATLTILYKEFWSTDDPDWDCVGVELRKWEEWRSNIIRDYIVEVVSVRSGEGEPKYYRMTGNDEPQHIRRSIKLFDELVANHPKHPRRHINGRD